jgi:hypothetical protein
VLNNIVQDAAKSFLVWPTKALPQTLDSNLYYNASVLSASVHEDFLGGGYRWLSRQ